VVAADLGLRSAVARAPARTGLPVLPVTAAADPVDHPPIDILVQPFDVHDLTNALGTSIGRRSGTPPGEWPAIGPG